MTDFYDMMDNIYESNMDVSNKKVLNFGGAVKQAPPPPSYYKSNLLGKKIVYGNTGISTNHIVGSKDEDLYFKVRLTHYSFKGETEHITLFYDNPREYCVHFLIELDKNARRNHRKESIEHFEHFEHRVNKMLAQMDTSIRIWEAKRNRALYELMVKAKKEEEYNQQIVNQDETVQNVIVIH